MNDQRVESEIYENNDSFADVVAAVALVAIFVTTCILWVSAQ